MILAATLLWAVEVILAKRLVVGLDARTLAAARMALGTVVLVAWVAVSGRGRRPARPRRRAVGLGAADGRAARRLRGHLVRRARACAGRRRHGGARVRRGRDRAALAGAADGVAVDAVGRRARSRPERRSPRSRRCAAQPRDAVGMTAGPLLFARYAYPPNALGLCGADETRTLLEYGDARASDGGLAELARTFEGAWPYLTLIAQANGIADPLDPRVVEAYWVGNEPARPRRPHDARPPCRGPLQGPDRPELDARRRRGRGRRRPAPLVPCVRRLSLARAAAHGHRRRAAACARPVPDDAGARPRRRRRHRDGARTAAALGRPLARARAVDAASRPLARRRPRARRPARTRATGSRCTGTSSATGSHPQAPRRSTGRRGARLPPRTASARLRPPWSERLPHLL